MSKQHRGSRRDLAEIALSVVEKPIGEKLAGKREPKSERTTLAQYPDDGSFRSA